MLIYFDSLGDYFISDDFSLILASRGGGSFLSFFSPFQNAQWHYSPILLISFFLEFLFFGLKPFWWHLVTLLCHSVNSYLVYCLAGKITKNSFIGLISAILFASYYLHYEVVIWISGLHTTLMVFSYLISFLLFIKYLEERKKLYYFFTLFFISMTLLTKEESITIVPIFFLYDFIFARKTFPKGNTEKNKNWGFLKKYVPFILVALVFSVIANRGTFKPGLLQDIFHFYHNSLLMLFIPNQFSIVRSFITVKNYPLIFSLLSGIIVFIFTSKNIRFCLLWVFITLLPSQIYSGVAARYLYLPSIGMAIIFAIVIYKISEGISHRILKKKADSADNLNIIRKNEQNISFLFIILFLLPIVAPGISFINDRKEEWHNSSIIVKNIVTAVNANPSDCFKGKNVFFINIPDSTISANSFFPSYILRNGLKEAMTLFKKNQAATVKLLKLKATPWQCTYESEISIDGLKAILPDPRNIVFVFDPAKKTIIRISEL